MPVLIGYIIGKVVATWVLIWDRAIRSLLHPTRPMVYNGRLPAGPRGNAIGVAILASVLALARVVLWFGVALGAIGIVLAGALWLIVPGPPFAHAFVVSMVVAVLSILARSASRTLEARLRGRSGFVT